MADRVFYPLLALVALALVALALVWPQGLGQRSWGPFARPEARLPPAPATTRPMARTPHRRAKGPNPSSAF